jgi:outer membrane protein assembly factor BamD
MLRLSVPGLGACAALCILANWVQVGDNIQPFSNAAQAAETAVDASTRAADREMNIGLYNLNKRNFTGAILRFKTLVTQYSASPQVEETLAHLAEMYLALHIASDAQTAVAVLDRKFPTSHFSIEAHDALARAGLDPVENENSWISRALK